MRLLADQIDSALEVRRELDDVNVASLPRFSVGSLLGLDGTSVQDIVETARMQGWSNTAAITRYVTWKRGEKASRAAD